jgi:hypothetical protein
MKLGFVAALLGLALGGCYGDVGIPLKISPTHAPMFGQVDVTLSGDLASLGEVDYFAIGGNQVINARWSGSSVIVTTQGSPLSGFADVVIRGKKGRVIRHAAFYFDPQIADVPPKWMAFGASFTQGTESNGIDPHTQLYGVTAQVARMAGVYIGLPLFDPQVTPPAQPSDFRPDCTRLPKTGAGLDTITAIATDPATGLLDLRRARVDWTLQARDVASGGAKLAEIDHGVQNPETAVIAHIVNDPAIDSAGALGGETTSQIDRVVTIDPDVAISTDLMGNDIDAAVVQSDDLHIELATPLMQATPVINDIVARLGKLHGDYFIANLPSLTFLPNVAALRARRLANGSDTEASFAAKVRAIDELTAGYNAALLAAARGHQNIHLVDFKAFVESVRGGVMVGGEQLTPARFDGLLSLDGLHLTDTGYALLANEFIRFINGTLTVSIPNVDVEAVHAQDALAPAKLRAAGLTCVPPAPAP